MSKQDIIKIRYPGSEISVNHYLGRRKGGGQYVVPECTAWKTEFQWLLKKCHLDEYKQPLEVTCSGYFKDERSAPDLSNLSKVINDAIAEIAGINDKFIHWHDGERVIGVKESPYLLITLQDDQTKHITIAPQSVSDVVKVVKGSKIPKKVKRVK
jgi:Holliday junction resolvase RusA-like endonuclease